MSDELQASCESRARRRRSLPFANVGVSLNGCEYWFRRSCLLLHPYSRLRPTAKRRRGLSDRGKDLDTRRPVACLPGPCISFYVHHKIIVRLCRFDCWRCWVAVRTYSLPANLCNSGQEMAPRSRWLFVEPWAPIRGMLRI